MERREEKPTPRLYPRSLDYQVVQNRGYYTKIGVHGQLLIKCFGLTLKLCSELRRSDFVEGTMEI
jgi:hypothetical protein